jgi:hypothetical protein
MRSASRSWTAGALGALVMIVACASDPSPAAPAGKAPTTMPTPATPPPATTPGGSTLEKDGATFTGPPAGGRGGSYSYALCPGGNYVRHCLDADCDRGTWRRDGDDVVLVSANPDTKGQETRLALSADGKTLGPPDIEGGPLTLSGAPAPTVCGT